MSLQEYKRKRNFKKTPEPEDAPSRTKKSKPLIFVIQKHAASHLHYDFRLEMKGVLKSWAVPKGPSLDPAQKRLAMHVEDHPIKYAKFEGTIPKGQYGGGTVLIWDNGIWEPIGDPIQSYKKGRLEFILHGKKLQGAWHLVRMKVDERGKSPWLLIKSKDEFSRNNRDYDIVEAQPDSVITSHKTQKAPPLIAPQLATLMEKAPEGKEWIHEVKYDGYRLMAYFENNNIKLITRNGKDWTKKLDAISKALEKLKLNNSLLDGELVAFDEKQHMSFQQLQNFLSFKEKASLAYYIFDLPFYEGQDLRDSPLLERKKILKGILKTAPSLIRYSDHISGNGEKIWKTSCGLGLEGIISKKADSIYESRRTKTWQKIKCILEEEFLILGFTQSKKENRLLGSLLLGYYDDTGKLQYSGHVGTGFTDTTLKMLFKKLSAIQIPESPFKKMPAGVNKKMTTWVQPQLVAQIKFTEWTEDGVLRHPVFLGLRADKNPEDIKQESPAAETTISNPSKIIFPEKNISKGDLANFYSEIAPWILPHIINRPLMIMRCPHGQNKECFFQKHYREQDLPKGLFLIEIQEKSGKNPYLYIKDADGLSALSQLAVIEIHPWGSNNKFIEQPDRMIFDLDPGENVQWKDIIKAAKRLRQYLLKYNLESFVKTSGKKGLHIVVPLIPHSDWEIIKEFSRQIAVEMADDYPNEYVATMTKSKRVGKIFIDFFRNGRGSTSVASYSCRANAQASVSLPLTWEELGKIKSADAYDIYATLKRMKSRKDPWPEFFKLKQKI